jgi:hypothetical protein
VTVAPGRRRPAGAWLAAAVVLTTAVGVVLAAPAPSRFRTAVDELPAPFDRWGVTVTEDDEEPLRLVVEFDSPALGRRATSVVWLPAAYEESHRDAPVTYFLHGQLDTHSFGAGQAAGAAGAPVPYPFAPPSPTSSFGGIDPGGTAADRSFLLVGVDNGPEPWCGHCWWVDGLDGRGVAAERHVLDEVVPLVEALFRVRTDRGGRGLLGNSMGANGSLLMGFRHPDRFGFVGALSPTVTGLRSRALFEAWSGFVWSTYVADQGYPAPADAEARFYALDPLFHVPGVVGSGVEVMTAIGDGCLPNDGRGVCAEEPPTGDPDQELLFRPSFDMWSAAATELGLPFTHIAREGAHDAVLNHDNFVRFFLPRMNEVFAGDDVLPERFSYRTLEASVEIFGWDLAVARPNLESLHVLGARTDGTAATFAGTGTLTATTPPVADAGDELRIVVVHPDRSVTETAATADAAGRVTFTVELAPARAVDETRELVEAGRFPFPQTEVRVETA